MKKVATKKQVKNNAIVFGFIIAGVFIFLSFLVPFLGIPLLIFFIVIWPIAIIKKLRQLPN